jgi:cysteine-S-conjugate beta-lyase
MHRDTQLVHFTTGPDDPHGAVCTPIYQTATFAQPSALGGGEYDYSRSGNPTRRVLEDQLARLEGAERAFAFASGMAALTAVVQLVGAGEEIVVGNDIYGGTYRLLSRILGRYRIDIRAVDTTDLDAVALAISPRTRLVLVETPTNPLQRITDLRAVAKLAHASNAWLAVDNSLMSPLLQQPLSLGADLVIHSCTKFICGHSDVTAGCVAVNDPHLVDELALLQNGAGGALAPFDCYLVLRGSKTLGLRLARQQANAGRLAEALLTHPAVSRVHYPGLPDHPGHALHASQARGFGAVIGFETGSATRSAAIVDATRLYTTSVSFGGVGSAISLPTRMSHASIPPEVRRRRALPEDLIRIAVGIEDPRDLVDDLLNAIDRATRKSA